MPQSTDSQKDDTPSGNTYSGLFVPSGGIWKDRYGSGWEDGERREGFVVGAENNQGNVSDIFLLNL